ncbi:hypothetical protein FG379_001099 [Cryptosporidium bovis]|uniref:uncharacterized protein n=1 Tax=Cryptosporidium bovis TaxID=310047 RepID=UPI00351A6C28|nr:hypothetical protein FG379_001099 [Cryptosporidium bovis]
MSFKDDKREVSVIFSTEMCERENKCVDEQNDWNAIPITNSKEDNGLTFSRKSRDKLHEFGEADARDMNCDKNEVKYELLLDRLNNSQALDIFKKLRSECIGLLDPPIVLEQQFILSNGEKISTRGKRIYI